jgi:hypothetical protein
LKIFFEEEKEFKVGWDAYDNIGETAMLEYGVADCLVDDRAGFDLFIFLEVSSKVDEKTCGKVFTLKLRMVICYGDMVFLIDCRGHVGN